MPAPRAQERHAPRVFELREQIPSGDVAADRALAAELREIAARIEPLVFDRGEREASTAYAFATITLAGLDAVCRGGLSAEEWWQRSRAAGAWVSAENRAVIELEVAGFLTAAGRTAEAQAALAGALDDVGDVARPWALAQLARIDRLRGATPEALARIEAAEAALSPEVPFHALVRGFLLGLRGDLLLDQGVLDEAAQWFERERALADELGSEELRASAVGHSSRLLLAAYHVEALADQARGALDDALRESASPAVAAHLVPMSARLAADEAIATGGDLEPALAALDAALALDGLAPDARLELGLTRTRVLLAAGELDRASAQLDDVRERERALTDGLELVGITGRARERGLVAALGLELALGRGDAAAEVAVALEDVEAAYDDLLDAWRRLPRRPGGVGFLEFHERLLVIDALVRGRVAVEPGAAGVEAALERVLDAQVLGSLARDLGATRPTARQVRQRIGTGGGVLIYLPAPARTQLFVVEPHATTCHELPSLVRIDRARRELQALLRRPPGRRRESAAELERVAEALTELLVPAPVRAAAERWSELTVVGAEFLGNVAFEALRTTDGEWLGLRVPIAYVTSVPLAIALERRAASRAHEPDVDLVLFAAPEPSAAARARWPRLEPLPTTRADVDALARPYERAETHFGDGATPTALQAVDLSRARVAQLVSHGVHDPTRERPAGLALAAAAGGDGLVWSADVEARPSAALVVLTACGAARGPARVGDDGVANLSGAFLRAGAGCVVLSRADLELASSLELSRRLHEEVAAGASPARALLEARRDVAADTRHADPFYFALVHAVGLGHAPLFEPVEPGAAGEAEPRRAPFVAALGIVALVAVLGLAVARRRRR